MLIPDTASTINVLVLFQLIAVYKIDWHSTVSSGNLGQMKHIDRRTFLKHILSYSMKTFSSFSFAGRVVHARPNETQVHRQRPKNFEDK